ncbi:FRG domain-containing protein [Lactiplantibacillus plantarum]|nr:FRG domain-containing protein [Lactiplantibacillus plantarum]MDO7795387.1 FRG domain-containing protein [Lactiplantibacillus plantarum]
MYSDGNTNFDRLALMQHHGLPTRLLDLTRNPLVALFFAVSGENQHSGEVVLFSNRLNKDYLSELPIVEQQTLTTLLAINESHPVSALQVVKSVFSDQIEVESSLVRLPLSAKEDITKVLNKLYAKPKDEWIHLFELASSSTRSMIDGFDENRPVVKLYHEIRRDIHDFTTDIDPLAFLVPKIVTPRVIDNRIKNQQGLFLFTPFVDTSLTGFEQATQNRLNLLRVTNGSKMVRFSIPCDSKADILAELAQCGITEDFIYPDHSHIASSIKDKFTTTENE